MKRIFMTLATVCVALSLGGCADTIQKAETAFNIVTGQIVTPTDVIVAANAFDGVKATATNYLRLPICPKATLCRISSATGPTIAAIKAGTADRNTLKAAVRANPTSNLTLVQVYQDLKNTTGTLENLIVQYNMGASK